MLLTKQPERRRWNEAHATVRERECEACCGTITTKEIPVRTENAR
jgi:hypothetical protein